MCINSVVYTVFTQFHLLYRQHCPDHISLPYPFRTALVFTYLSIFTLTKELGKLWLSTQVKILRPMFQGTFYLTTQLLPICESGHHTGGFLSGREISLGVYRSGEI